MKAVSFFVCTFLLCLCISKNNILAEGNKTNEKLASYCKDVMKDQFYCNTTFAKEIEQFVALQSYEAQLKSVFEKDFSRALDLMLEVFPTTNVVTALAKYYENESTELAKMCSGAKLFKPSTRKINTIGIFYPRIYDGGVERVISLQIPIFIELGYRVVLILESSEPAKEYPIPPSVKKVIIARHYSNGRIEDIENALTKNHIDVFLYHCASSMKLLFDLMISKSLNIPFVIGRNELAAQDILCSHPEWKNNFRYYLYRLSDKLIVLTTMDEGYYNVMGCNTKYIPNPIALGKTRNNYSDNDGYILWLGRLDKCSKNYFDLVPIMKHVVEQNQNAKMIIVGGDKVTAFRELYPSIIKNGLHSNIEWHPYTNDVSKFYKKAKIHLVTSSLESFSMVIAESKSYGIPLVTYDLPYLELLKDGKGYIAVEQNDIKGTASAIVQLLNNQTLCEKMSKEAKKSIETFSNFDFKKAWSDVFNEMERKHASPMLSNREKDVQLFISTMFSHYKKYYLLMNEKKQFPKNNSWYLFFIFPGLLAIWFLKCIVQKIMPQKVKIG